MIASSGYTLVCPKCGLQMEPRHGGAHFREVHPSDRQELSDTLDVWLMQEFSMLVGNTGKGRI